MRANGYPCWLYSVAGPRLIQTEAEHEALEGDWYESPADIPAAEVARAELTKRAEALGITVDGRWGTKRLESEVDKAETAKAAEAEKAAQAAHLAALATQSSHELPKVEGT